MDTLSGVSIVVVIVVGAIALFLTILGVLLPYFVWQIHQNVAAMRGALSGSDSLASGTDFLLTDLTLREIRDLLKGTAFTLALMQSIITRSLTDQLLIIE